MQRRKFHRNARTSMNATSRGSAPDGVDCRLVSDVIPPRVGGRQRRFAEHVVRVAVTARFQWSRSFERFFDRLPGNELLAKKAHRKIDALANQRLATAREQAAECTSKAGFGVRCDQLAADHQAPCGGVDEQRLTAPEVGAPVAAPELVA